MRHNSTTLTTESLVDLESLHFSVLMSIYSATRAGDLDRCLESLSVQSALPNEIVLVRDGPVDISVEHCIENYAQFFPFRHLHFPQNRGLGHALRDGLLACDHELVARVDSDDWSVPERFELQIAFLKQNPSISVIGGWLREHYQSSAGLVPVVRQTPVDYRSLKRAARRRNPINHPTVMFRKSHVLESGNYEPCQLFEDYFLWARMLVHGYHLANLPQVLAETKVDAEYFSRRGGTKYVRKELRLLEKLGEIGFFSFLDTSIFILSRLPIRLMPTGTRRRLYKLFLRNA
jgi:glycosyltransferase involved in cell wall biosynthesis